MSTATKSVSFLVIALFLFGCSSAQKKTEAAQPANSQSAAAKPVDEAGPAKFNLDRSTVVILDGILKGKKTKKRLKADIKCQAGACVVPGKSLKSDAKEVPLLKVTTTDTANLLHEMKLAKKHSRSRVISGNKLECNSRECTVTFESAMAN